MELREVTKQAVAAARPHTTPEPRLVRDIAWNGQLVEKIANHIEHSKIHGDAAMHQRALKQGITESGRISGAFPG
jgi:hypothetical protein